MPEVNGPEFYIGYVPNAPPGLGRHIRTTVAALVLLAVALAVIFAAGQHGFDAASRYEFLEYREYQGTYLAWPYPALTTSNGVDYLLAGEGKRGVELPANTADGSSVRLKGALAENGSNRILELLPGSFSVSGNAVASPRPRAAAAQGMVTISGEIVDTKCYFGVMNPGKGKVHRACAARCISGGLPAGLLARDRAGTMRVFLLTASPGGEPLGKQLLDYVGEPVRATGRVIRTGSLWVLETSAGSIQRE